MNYTNVNRPMTAKEAAKYAGVSPSSIAKAVKAGGLVGYVPLGMQRRRYTTKEVDQWLKGKQQ